MKGGHFLEIFHAVALADDPQCFLNGIGQFRCFILIS